MPSAVGKQMIPGGDPAHSSAPSEPRCVEYYDISRPDRPSIANTNFCLPFVSSAPRLYLQINQCTNWSKGSVWPIFNIWRPGLFGTSLTQLGPDPVKLTNKTDFVVTAYEDDMEALKAKNTNAISFSTKGLVAGVDVDAPPWYGCKMCNSHRGYVFLPNGERWHWVEIYGEHYKFKREDDHRDQDVPLKTLIWEFQNSWTPSKDLPADLPFAVNRDARVCRVSESSSLGRPGIAGSPVAVMNHDGFIFFDGVGLEMAEIQTEDNRALILISGLAIAKYEGWLAER
ncbi:hypothetical protein PENSOL_c022G02250 [Penicillium solitum]|uniref:Uncharacterized protein n=1 Tax=Penicillium solitum TaxID=60172 RepID=A0A1V6R0U2_9EURO|nr:uncharacterized protein PENSOL_c022G02250 [Penicillium solitum]OQD95068.1 hypothetical protein PENSOL_c022G02250 [Penicillium solitum]